VAVITPAPGKGSLVQCNGTTLKLTTWERTRTPGKLPYATTGMAADADGNYETPHAAGIMETVVVLEGIFDTALPFHGAPFNIRAGTTQSFRFGQVAAGPLTPAISYVIGPTTDGNRAAELGFWRAELWPATDATAGYFTG
jgi:hypothetical protein